MRGIVYAATEIAFLLVLATALGVVIGYLLAGLSSRPAASPAAAVSAVPPHLLPGTTDERNRIARLEAELSAQARVVADLRSRLGE